MLNTVFDFNCTGGVQTFTVEHSGNYKLEVWGAQGGDAASYTGGHGGYSSGVIKLSKGQTIYIYVGQKGPTPSGGAAFNGGGKGVCCGASGGGGTDIRTVESPYNDLTSPNSRVIVAGGGGGASLDTPYSNGGYGGGKIGGPSDNGRVATQSSGYGLFQGGPTSNNDNAGGGGGYYGGFGGSGSTGGRGGGGSGYIGGVIDGIMYGGNTTMPSPTGGIETGHTGNGYARITLLLDEYVFFFKQGDNYFLPCAKFFDETTKSFVPLTLDEIMNETENDLDNLLLFNIKTPFTIGTTTYNPLDYIDLTQFRLCVVPVYSRIDEILSNATLGYVPSSTALSKTSIRIKKNWTPLNEDLNNAYFDITAVSKNNISYTFDYYSNESVTNICDVIDTEIFKDSFYSTFKLNSPNSMLKSVGIYTVDKVNYTKIKEDHLNIERNFENTWITFRNAYNKVYINQINKVHFKYIKETIDTF